MTTIMIVPDSSGSPAPSYRAIAGNKESSGKTAGEALDALTAQLSQPDAVTLVVLQRNQPDQHFTAEQRARLADLMARWRRARDVGTELSAEEQAELNALVEAEVRAATARAKALADSLLP